MYFFNKIIFNLSYLICIWLFNLYFVWSVKFVLSISMVLYSFIFEITHKYTVTLFKVIRRKQTSKISQFFPCNHKINESSAKVTTHDWIVCLYSKNVSFYAFMSDKLFNFFRNIFNITTIEINNFPSFTK